MEKTEREAISEAEKWLSEKITKDYFNRTNKDENEIITFELYTNCTRGSVLSSAIFIEYIYMHGKMYNYVE